MMGNSLTESQRENDITRFATENNFDIDVVKSQAYNYKIIVDMLKNDSIRMYKDIYVISHGYLLHPIQNSLKYKVHLDYKVYKIIDIKDIMQLYEFHPYGWTIITQDNRISVNECCTLIIGPVQKSLKSWIC